MDKVLVPVIYGECLLNIQGHFWHFNKFNNIYRCYFKHLIVAHFSYCHCVLMCQPNSALSYLKQNAAINREKGPRLGHK